MFVYPMPGCACQHKKRVAAKKNARGLISVSLSRKSFFRPFCDCTLANGALHLYAEMATCSWHVIMLS